MQRRKYARSFERSDRDCVCNRGLGQSANPPRVFQLSNGNATDAREIASVVQSILAPEVDADKQGNSITVKTGPPDFALGQWLVETLDKQVQGDSLEVDRYPGTTGNGAGVAVFRLSRKEPIQTYSEMVNAARTIPEMTDVFPLGNMRAIVARATPEKLEMSEWFLRHLEAGGPGSAPAEAKFSATVNPYALKQHPELVPDHLEARVLYTRERLPVQTFQEIVNAVRTIPELTKVFPVTGKGAVALRVKQIGFRWPNGSSSSLTNPIRLWDLLATRAFPAIPPRYFSCRYR